MKTSGKFLESILNNDNENRIIKNLLSLIIIEALKYIFQLQ